MRMMVVAMVVLAVLTPTPSMCSAGTSRPTGARPTTSPTLTTCGGLNDPGDWLVAGCKAASSLTTSMLPDGSTNFTLSNGIVSRTLVRNKTTGACVHHCMVSAYPSTAIVTGRHHNANGVWRMDALWPILSVASGSHLPTGLLGTSSIRMLGGDGAGELLAHTAPEVLLVVNDVPLVVGGAAPFAAVDHRPRATFSGYRTGGTVRAFLTHAAASRPPLALE